MKTSYVDAGKANLINHFFHYARLNKAKACEELTGFFCMFLNSTFALHSKVILWWRAC